MAASNPARLVRAKAKFNGSDNNTAWLFIFRPFRPPQFPCPHKYQHNQQHGYPGWLPDFFSHQTAVKLHQFGLRQG